MRMFVVASHHRLLTFIQSILHLIRFNLISFNLILFAMVNISIHHTQHTHIYIPLKCGSFFIYLTLLLVSKLTIVNFNRISVCRRFFMTLSRYDQCFFFFRSSLLFIHIFFKHSSEMVPLLSVLYVWFVSQFKYHAPTASIVKHSTFKINLSQYNLQFIK